MSQAVSAATTRSTVRSKPKGPRVSKSAKAGLQFPVGRVERKIREGNYGRQVSQEAPVYLAGVLEYILAEVLDTAGEITVDNKRGTINGRAIRLAIGGDAELNTLFADAIVSGGGVIPYVHEILQPKSKKKKEQQEVEA